MRKPCSTEFLSRNASKLLCKGWNRLRIREDSTWGLVNGCSSRSLGIGFAFPVERNKGRMVHPAKFWTVPNQEVRQGPGSDIEIHSLDSSCSRPHKTVAPLPRITASPEIRCFVRHCLVTSKKPTNRHEFVLPPTYCSRKSAGEKLDGSAGALCSCMIATAGAALAAAVKHPMEWNALQQAIAFLTSSRLVRT
jgi:hypothetical protein